MTQTKTAHHYRDPKSVVIFFRAIGMYFIITNIRTNNNWYVIQSKLIFWTTPTQSFDLFLL